ncbi:MAG: ECF transporter S component [Clostridia bacterium]|nr:ECF transporter S component [Clostridia bacterium]
MTLNKFDTRKMVFLAILTALVVVLQLLGSFIRFGTFSISLVLIPIAVGAALCGPLGGAWLGLVFGAVVLISGDASVFLAINPAGTFITVLLKGALCGLAAGMVFNMLRSGNQTVAAIAAAVVCPIVNTGIFLIGCRLFFFDTIKEWANGTNAFVFMITGFVGLNFVFELIVNVVLSPVIVRLVDYVSPKRNDDR